MAIARRMCSRWRLRGSWLSVSSRRTARHPSIAVPSVVVDHRPVEQAHHHLVVDPEVRPQRFGLAADELVERVLRPVGVAPLGLLLLDDLLLAGGRGGLLVVSLVLHDVRWRLDPHVAAVVESLAPGPPGDLRELPVRQDAHAGAVVLAQLREQHRPDRHVDADAERVGPADDLEQTVLGELLDEQAVLRQQAGVVHTDAGRDVAPQVLADRGVEAEVAERVSHRLLLGLRQWVQCQVVLRRLGRILLGEVHEVDRRLVGLEELADAVMQRGRAVLEVERHRALHRLDDGRRATGPRRSGPARRS